MSMIASTLDVAASIFFVAAFSHIARRKQLIANSILFYGSSICFLLAMMPMFDELARFSIWIHSLQSVIIHHFCPLLWILALKHPATNYRIINSLTWKPISILLMFALITWIWMLPSLHAPLMHSAVLYMVMKWLMALSGLMLCFLILQNIQNVAYWKLINNMTIIYPLVGLGLAMMLIPNLYSSTHSSQHHQHMMMHNLPTWLRVSGYSDQLIGGLIFLFSALFYIKLEKSTRTISSHTRRFVK